MKTYKLFALALVAMISFNSCSDFLTTELTDATKTVDSYYKTPDEAFTALTGCYNGLNMAYNSGVAFPVAAEVFSDNCFGGTGSSDGYGYAMIDEFNPKISPADISMYGSTWKAYYQAVYRCNVLISKLDGVKWDDNSLKKQYKAEAKFLRAYFYFDMVRYWENIPLLTKPTLVNVPQAAPDSVYTQIVKDLRYASDSLQPDPYNKLASGRVTRWAAESLLARVYLFYSGYYGKTSIGGETAATALAGLEDVITKSQHSLVSNFTTLWPAASIAKKVSYAGESNPEVVFSIKNSSTQDYNGNITGNSWMVMEGIRTESHFPYQYGWGACTVDPKLWSTFDAADPRRFASIMSIKDENIPYTKQADAREYTGYFMKKYSPVCDSTGTSIVTNFQIGQYQDYFAIRYSDVLLMAAELGSPNAQSYLDKVRSRAGMASVTASKENILAERRLEFVGEGIRYWDVLRQGLSTAAETIANNTTVSNFDDSGVHETAAQFKAQIIATRGFQQIPDEQITLSNGTLKQNVGWEK